MNKKIIVLFLLSILIGSISASAISIDDKKIKTSNQNDPINWKIADLVIDSESTNAKINLNDLVLDLNIPDQETTIPVTFSFDCKVKNEKLLNTETWVFIVEMKKYPNEGYIILEEIVKNDELIEEYPWEETISTTVDFSRDYPWEERAGTFEQRYSLRVRCEYYDDGVQPGDQAPDDHAVENVNPVVVLKNHDAPTKPTIISSDISDGDEVGRGTYNFKVRSIDPNGDDIRYTFYWGDSTTTYYPSQTGYVESGTEAECSYTYGENHDFDDYTITISVIDEFGRTDYTTIDFTLPKTKTLCQLPLFEIIKIHFPQISELFEKI